MTPSDVCACALSTRIAYDSYRSRDGYVIALHKHDMRSCTQPCPTIDMKSDHSFRSGSGRVSGTPLPQNRMQTRCICLCLKYAKIAGNPDTESRISGIYPPGARLVHSVRTHKHPSSRGTIPFAFCAISLALALRAGPSRSYLMLVARSQYL